MDVDGRNNSILEMDTLPLTSKADNPFGGTFTVKETRLRRESEGRRQINPASSRLWEVINPSEKNALGQPVGYMLMPGENSVSYATPDSWLKRRAGFLNGQLWITRYDPSQMYHRTVVYDGYHPHHPP